jgi:hypothetical protein
MVDNTITSKTQIRHLRHSQEPASNYGKIAWPNTHTEQDMCSSLFPLTKTVKVENTSGSLILFRFMFSLFLSFWLNKLWHSLCFCIKNIDTFVKQFVQYWWFFIFAIFLQKLLPMIVHVQFTFKKKTISWNKFPICLQFMSTVPAILDFWGQSWSWLYGNWIYNYLWHAISAYHHWCCEFALCDKVCQWLATSLWFSQGSPVFSTNKTDRHNITIIVLKVAFNTIKPTIQTKKSNHVAKKKKI